jgi:DNA-binding response OmpR family regulator
MRILLIEDDRIIGMNLVKLISRQGFSVDLAVNKELGLEKGLAEDYDLFVIDRMLPDGDGVDLCRELRNEGVRAPVLMLTAKGQVEDRVEGLDAGADDYLAKPFEIVELVARIKALLRRRDELLPVLIRVGDLEIDLNNNRVRRGGREISLSPKEYAILEYLARNRDRVVDRMEILTHVWDENADLFSNTIEVHLRYLRRKIDEDREKKLIRTVRGKGYQLCET